MCPKCVLFRVVRMKKRAFQPAYFVRVSLGSAGQLQSRTIIECLPQLVGMLIARPGVVPHQHGRRIADDFRERLDRDTPSDAASSSRRSVVNAATHARCTTSQSRAGPGFGFGLVCPLRAEPLGGIRSDRFKPMAKVIDSAEQPALQYTRTRPSSPGSMLSDGLRSS